jgi:hypothetical protein
VGCTESPGLFEKRFGRVTLWTRIAANEHQITSRPIGCGHGLNLVRSRRNATRELSPGMGRREVCAHSMDVRVSTPSDQDNGQKVG